MPFHKVVMKNLSSIMNVFPSDNRW